MDTTARGALRKGSFLSFMWNGLLRIQTFILIVSGLVIILGISLVVLFRYLLKLDLFGMEEIITLFAFWLYFMGSAYGAYERSHISADIINAYVRHEKTRYALKALTSLFTAALCLMFTKWAWDYVSWTFKTNPKSTALNIPLIYTQAAILVGFVLMSFYFIVHLLDDLREFGRRLKSK